MWSATVASCGKCSLIWTPSALVLIGLNSPPLAWSGLRSNRSMVLGPPGIHKRMHERLRCLLSPAAAASDANQLDAPRPSRPAPASRSHARRDSTFRLRIEVTMVGPSQVGGRGAHLRYVIRNPQSPIRNRSVVDVEFGAIEQHPECVAQGFLRISFGAPGLQILHQAL